MSEKHLKLKTSEDRNIWFAGCTHLNHDKKFVYDSRGFLSPLDHKNYVISYINNHVKENDILFHLGDFCLNTTREQFEQDLAQIKCKNIYLLWGNHPNPIYNIYKEEVDKILPPFGTNDELLPLTNIREIYPLRYKNIVFMGRHLECWINNWFCVLNHYPIMVWNYIYADRSIHITSHSHGNLPESRFDTADARRLDVGVDNCLAGWRKPILSFDDIVKWMEKRPIGKVKDHHGNMLYTDSKFSICPEKGIKIEKINE